MTAFVVTATISQQASRAQDPETVSTVTRLDGSEIRGMIAEITPDRLLMSIEDTSTEIALDEVLSIESRSTLRETSRRPVIEFANGDRLHGDIVALRDEALLLQDGTREFAVPLERLRGFSFQPLRVNDGSAAILHRSTGRNDLVLFTNGDRLAGQFAALSESELTVEADGRSVVVPRERIAAVAFSPELIARPQEAFDRQIVQFQSGWLTVRDLTRDRRGTWKGTTTFGEEATWRHDEIQRVTFLGPNVQLLSELPPTTQETESFLTRQWPVRENRAVTGEPLSAGGVPYARGLGVHSRTRLTYRLNREYRSFSVIAGLTASAGKVGCVEFAIELDGKEVFRSGPISADSDPLRIDRLPLDFAETMTLVVDFSRNGDILDRANWCNPILVRESP